MTEMRASKPIAVLISDVHYNLNTLPLADAAMRMAIEKANILQVPLVVAGDLHDTKANMRGECINAMLKTFALCNTPCYILVGNHCRLNEKSEEHVLDFLSSAIPFAVVSLPRLSAVLQFNCKPAHLIPYHHDPEALKAYLKNVDHGSLLIMHQGVEDSNSGDYIQDKSALPKECFKDFRVISGHYHTRQDIRCGPPRKGAVGLFSYIGNPFTLTYGEAQDPEKGFQILHHDGLLEFVPTDLRRHQVIEIDISTLGDDVVTYKTTEDLIWVKIKGSREELAKLTRETIAQKLGLFESFRLDLIPTDAVNTSPVAENKPQSDVLDDIIDAITCSDSQKTRLKDLWKGLV